MLFMSKLKTWQDASQEEGSHPRSIFRSNREEHMSKVLRMLPTTPATTTHDYELNGSYELFAALNVDTGTMIIGESHTSAAFVPLSLHPDLWIVGEPLPSGGSPRSPLRS
jgi:hypothetical protein